MELHIKESLDTKLFVVLDKKHGHEVGDNLWLMRMRNKITNIEASIRLEGFHVQAIHFPDFSATQTYNKSKT